MGQVRIFPDHQNWDDLALESLKVLVLGLGSAGELRTAQRLRIFN